MGTMPLGNTLLIRFLRHTPLTLRVTPSNLEGELPFLYWNFVGNCENLSLS